jgi:phosphoheptose isomerase
MTSCSSAVRTSKYVQKRSSLSSIALSFILVVVGIVSNDNVQGQMYACIVNCIVNHFIPHPSGEGWLEI